LKTYEALGNKREPAASFARGVLDGSVSCPGNSKKAVTSDSVTISCPTTSYDVEYGTVSLDCSFTVEVDDGIYYYYFYAYDVVNGNYLYNYPSNDYYYDSTASQTTITGTLTFTLPQYAPSGSWTVYGYAYDLNYENYVYGTTYFFVEATVNDQGPPVLKNITFLAVDSASSTSGNTPFVATDDLSGVASFYVYFYDSSYDVFLGDGSWSAGGSVGILSISTDATLYIESAPFGTYYPIIELTDVVGFEIELESSNLASLGLPSSIINAGNNCTAGKYLPAGTQGSCLECPAGTYSVFGSIACTVCPPGYKGNGKGASSCLECGAGYFSAGGSASCNLCPAGKYSSEAGSAVCTPCYPGTNSSAGSTTCLECTPGTYSCGGAATCSPCAVGTYNPYYYASYCTQCEAGTYADVVGSTSCTPCAVGTYAAKVGATSCTACPSGESSPAGSFSTLACSA
jgi:hypothetical protein